MIHIIYIVVNYMYIAMSNIVACILHDYRINTAHINLYVHVYTYVYVVYIVGYTMAEWSQPVTEEALVWQGS